MGGHRAGVLVSSGVVVTMLGIVLYVVMGIVSAIDYNVAEQPEGAFTPPPPVWITFGAVASIGLVVAGIVPAVVGLAIRFVSGRRHRTPSPE